MSDRLFSVADQVVLVVGASRGIGRAIARGFAERGAVVWIAGRDAQTLDKAAQELSTGTSHRVTPIVCDTMDRDQVEQAVEQLRSAHGRIDTLVQVAGINRRKPALDVSGDDFDTILGINLSGAFAMAQAVGRLQIESGKGNQVHVTSLNAIRPLTHVVPYAVSKAGLDRMVQALALEWGPKGIRVNALAPGFILTDLTEKLWSDPQMQEWGKANTPLQRLGRPDDLVGAALFLASEASQFMTGQSLVIDGGFSSGWAWPIPANNQ